MTDTTEAAALRPLAGHRRWWLTRAETIERLDELGIDLYDRVFRTGRCGYCGTAGAECRIIGRDRPTGVELARCLRCEDWARRMDAASRR